MSWLTDSVGKRQGNRAIARNRSAACNEESIPETEYELKRGRKDGCRCSAACVSCLPDDSPLHSPVFRLVQEDNQMRQPSDQPEGRADHRAPGRPAELIVEDQTSDQGGDHLHPDIGQSEVNPQLFGVRQPAGHGYPPLGRWSSSVLSFLSARGTENTEDWRFSHLYAAVPMGECIRLPFSCWISDPRRDDRGQLVVPACSCRKSWVLRPPDERIKITGASSSHSASRALKYS